MIGGSEEALGDVLLLLFFSRRVEVLISFHT